MKKFYFQGTLSSSSSVTFTNKQQNSIDIIADIHGGVVANGVKCQIWGGTYTTLIDTLECNAADTSQYVLYECDGITVKATLRLDTQLYSTFSFNCTNSQGLAFTEPLDPSDAVDVVKATYGLYDKVNGQFDVGFQILTPGNLSASFTYMKVIETYSNGTIKEHKDTSPIVSQNKDNIKILYPFVDMPGKKVELEIEVISNTGYMQLIRREILFPTVDVVTTKKAFTTNSSLLDSLQNILIKPSYQKNFPIDYFNEYYVNNTLLMSTAKSEYEYKPPALIGCYAFQVKIASEKTFPFASPLIHKCIKAGVKMTVNYDRGQGMGRPSKYEITFNITDSDTCMALDFGDGSSKIFREPGVSDNICKDWGQDLTGITYVDHDLRNTALIETEHTYVVNGTFTMRVIAINKVHRQIEELEISVLAIDCSSPQTSLIGYCHCLFFFSF